ncbi:MAG: Rieske 2Fe-2S domain-containing protein [Aliidongia sp.]
MNDYTERSYKFGDGPWRSCRWREIEPRRSYRALCPAWVYDHPEVARLEYERILLPSWQILCHVNSIPKPGDYVTLDLGRDSIVATRAGDGTIHAFHNVCRHRAARLLEAAVLAAP